MASGSGGNSGNNGNSSNNSSTNNVDVKVEHTETHTQNTTMPRAHGINQPGGISTSESGPGFIPRGNATSANSDFNHQNNPALGQRKMHNNDLKKSDLDDKKDKNQNNKNNGNDQNNPNYPNNKKDLDNKNDPNNKKDDTSDDDSNNVSMPSADPNNNINANNAKMNSDKPGDNKKDDDNKFDPRKQRDNSSFLPSNKRSLARGLSGLSKGSSGKNALASTLNEMWQNPVIRRKIIMGAGIVFGVIFIFVIFMALLSSLIVTLSSSMCDDDSSTFSYSGSGDVAEFMCGMQEPTNGYVVTSNFGYSVDSVHSGRLHSGIDLGVSTGTPVYAVQSGKVVGTSTASGYGYDVVIDHGGGLFTRYGHNSKVLVSKGDFVNKGQEIAKAGSTGNSTGPHVHFEIMKTTESNLFSGHQDPNAYFNKHNDFMKSCGSSATATYTSYTPSTVDEVSVQSYDKVKNLKTLTNTTGTIKKLPATNLVFQSFAYNNGLFYLQKIKDGSNGKDGFIYKYDSNIKQQGISPTIQAIGHGNGLTYSTKDNKLYSVTVSGIRNNKKATIIDPGSLKVVGHKNLDHGTSAIAYDRITNRFITSSGAPDNSGSTTAYLYVYESDLSTPTGAKKIAKKRWKTPADIAAYGGVIYVAVSTYHLSSNNNYIDMYDEDTGNYLGSYSASYNEIEGVDIDADGQIVLLFHKPGSPFLQFTGIKAQVINNGSSSSSSGSSSDSGEQCCTDSGPSYTSASAGNYCPNGITVEGSGTYDLDEYIAGVITAENSYEKNGNIEASKANAIAARTYALNRTDNCTKPIGNSSNAQNFTNPGAIGKRAASETSGQVMLYNGEVFSAEYDAFCINDSDCPDASCSGDSCSVSYTKKPSQEKHKVTLRKGSSLFDSVVSGSYNNIGHGRGMSQLVARQMQDEGKTYAEILEFFYANDVVITGASSSNSSCSLGAAGTYTNGKIWDYNQADYSDAYCGGTVADSGCGPTSMAMVVSTLLNEKHDPSELAKIATNSGYCSTSSHQYFTAAAQKYGLKALKTTDHEEVLTALNRGDSLVIANVTSETVNGINNFWTSYGHYIVLAGHEGRNVWVQDPNKSTTGRGNTQGDGVYDFDKYIKPATRLGYIIVSKA